MEIVIFYFYLYIMISCSMGREMKLLNAVCLVDDHLCKWTPLYLIFLI